MIKILWVIPKWTLPAIDGARVATERLLTNVVGASVTVDVLCFANSDEVIDPRIMHASWSVRKIFSLKRSVATGGKSKLFYFLLKLITRPFTPLTFASFDTVENKNFLSRKLEGEQYDFILLDGLHLAACLPRDKNGFITGDSKVIYRAHNIESDLWKKSSGDTRNPLKKLIFKFQYYLVKKFEKFVLENSYGVAPISVEDQATIEKSVKVKNMHLTPLGLNFDQVLDKCEAEKLQLLFLGKLDWAPNKEGLKWILDDVWPSVITNRDDIVLNIVGSGNKQWLEKYKNLKGVKLHGFVKDIKDAYKACHYTIAPITFGSGTRIKVLESYAFGRKIVSTKMGVQGAGMVEKDYIHCESTQEWIETLSNLEIDQGFEISAIDTNLRLSENFGDKKVGSDFQLWLESLR
jgi:glycosyltransferase involved in cell wall biosynthesis